MKYYDEIGNEITNPDLTKGSVTNHTKVTGFHYELLDGTNGYGVDGKGLYQKIIDSEEYGVYHVYTAEELEEIKKNKINGDINDRINNTQLGLCDAYELTLSLLK